jgi:quercetin dioxygenase-like cupin family protein/ribosome-associated toxin RatA of RatAB toxin-antitoxin module
MSAHTECRIEIDAPLNYVWRRMNDVASWPNLYTEYASVEVLEQAENKVTFRITMHPDEQGRVWSWVSERITDPVARTVYARRVETGPFEFMNIFWYFTELGPERTRMCWVQDFAMKPTAPIDDAGMAERITTNSKIQMEVIKRRLESARLRVRSVKEVAPNTRRGGDLRVLLSPADVGSTSGFAGVVRLAPGEGISEHYHPYSEEFLLVSSGELTVDLNSEPRTVGAGEGLFIPREVRHRLRNMSAEEVVVTFFLSPLAPRPELGHVDTETAGQAAALIHAQRAAELISVGGEDG